MARKSTDAQINKRVNEIYKWLLLEKGRQEILQLSASWKLSERTIDEYTARARERLEEKQQREIDKARERSRARWLRLIEDAYSEGDLRTVATAQSALDKVDGVNAPEKVEHSGAITWAQFIADHDANEE